METAGDVELSRGIHVIPGRCKNSPCMLAACWARVATSDTNPCAAADHCHCAAFETSRVSRTAAYQRLSASRYLHVLGVAGVVADCHRGQIAWWYSN